ncbi:hypothetical protein CU098_011856, partial [Rhizopus stolonifer]
IAELKKFLPTTNNDTEEEVNDEQSKIYINATFDGAVQAQSSNNASVNRTSLGKHDIDQSASEMSKRQRKQVVNDNYISSETISDEDDPNSDLFMSESSYVPSEFSEAPWGYVCKMGMPEFDTDDISKMPLDIVDEYLVSLVFEAQELITNHTLFPTDIENHDEAAEAKAMTLPNNVYENIREFRRSIQSRKLYNQPQASINHLELSMNNIICSELNLIASSVASFLSPFFSAYDRVQMEFYAVSWLRPDILIRAEQHGKVVEVACGEVKNINATQEKLNEDKTRVLEIMKRQLHIRLRHAKSSNKAVTFEILVQVSLLRMTMDLVKGVYVYHEQTPFTLPTTYETYAHMDISLELIYSSKVYLEHILIVIKIADNNFRLIAKHC